MSGTNNNKKAAAANQPRKGQVGVRMYNVGFGDCFLVWIHTAEGIRKILVDCGSRESGGNDIKTIAKQVIQDATDPDGIPRIDVVICSHMHQDHISGFDPALWKNVQVREVWMPWTESDDPEAKAFRKAQHRLALALCQRLQARLKSLGAAPAARPLRRLMDLALLAVSNDSAASTLKTGFAPMNGTGAPLRQYWPEKNQAPSFESKALPGVKIHLLGPSRDTEVIRNLEPPKEEQYLRLLASLGGSGDTAPAPFRENWSLPADYFQDRLTPQEQKQIREAGDMWDFAATVALDKAINGTSLMLIFEVGKRVLLFPGDMEWGCWELALKSDEWSALLARTNFYKVSHHGSYNGTPKDFAAKVLPKGAWAMFSTKITSSYPDIPKPELEQILRDRSVRIARSDQPASADPGYKPQGNLYIDLLLR